MVKNLTSQMVEYGQVKRGELGIMGTELNSELAKAMKVDAQRGAFVSQVLPNSSAAKAGIKAGDVITSLNGKPISSFAALRAQVGTMPVGSKLTLGLLRDGKQVNVNLELQQSSQNQVDSSTIFNGIEGAEMSNKGKDQGVVVNNMKTGTPAAQIGPQPLPENGKGFSLQSVNFTTTPYIFIILWAFAQCRTLRTSLC